MALPTPPAYTTPIPNNPFYSNPSYIIEGAYYPFVVGSGLSVSPDGIISASGSGGGAVASVTGGAGISVAPATGNVVVTNTGVTSLIAGAGIAVTANTGSIVISSTASAGTVTTVNSGTGLTGGPIVSTGTLAIANTGVTAATYTNPTLAINAQGQITSASNGTSVTSVSGSLPITVTPGATPTVAINAASTTNCGAVLLSDSTTSTSSTEAATSLAVKTAYDAAIAAIPKACVTAKGTLVTGTAASIPVALPVGADGLVLTACAACTEGLFWAAGGSVPSATPTVEGIVFGCTDSTNFNYGLGDTIFSALTTGTLNVAIGAGALNSTDTGTTNVAVGIGSGFANTSGNQNIAIGAQSLFFNSTGGLNVAVGSLSLQNATGDANTALGNYAGNLVTTGCNNILIGNQSGGAGAGALDTGCDNVIIGNCLSVASSSGSCQLAIGTTTFCWLSGTSTGAIQPGAGIIDCANSCGTAGQILASNGSNAVCWRTIAAATPANLGLTYACVNGPAAFPAISKENASFGYDAMGTALTTGESNTAVGNSAANQMTTGCFNASVGYLAGFGIVSGCFNTALGGNAMFGSDNAAESRNTGVGYDALTNNGGSGNVAVGYQAGLQSGSTNVGGDNNSFFGNQAGCDLTSGSQNVVIGCGVQAASPTGSCQLAIGFSATNNWLTGNSTKAIKPGAGIIDCAASTGTAGQVLMSNGSNAICWGAAGGASAATPTVAGIVLGCTTDTNSAVGCNALLAISSGAGTDNVAMGLCAGASLTNSVRNVALGSLALSLAINNSQNVAVGYAALQVSTFGQNVAVGASALSSLTGGNQNVALGNNTLRLNTVGVGNTAVGHRALQNSTGDSNTGVGQDALSFASGGGNVAIGLSTGQNVSSGASNTLLGSGAGGNINTGCYNVMIGSGASPGLNSNCCLYIGTDAAAGFNWLSGDSTKAIKPGAGIVDTTNSCGTANQVLVSTGANAIQWKSVNSALAVPNYGSFIDTTTQSVTSVTNPQPVTLNTTLASANFSIVSGSQVTAAVAGTYNLQFSIQLETTTASLSNVEIWLAKNGTAVADSNTRFTTKGSGEAAFAALNYVESLAAGDYLELIWASGDANMQMITAPSLFGGPQIPSVILTIVPVGA